MTDPDHFEFAIADLFCGGGTMSSHAAAVPGAKLVLGVDSFAPALRCFQLNHPGVGVSGATLPQPWNAMPGLSTTNLYMHCSPPCTAFSQSRHGKQTEAEVEHGLRLLFWSVEFCIQHKVSCFSIENSDATLVHDVGEYLKSVHPGLVDHIRISATDLGSCADRSRTILGTPSFIDKLRALTPVMPVTVRDAFEAAGVAMPVNAHGIRGSSKDKHGNYCIREVAKEPSYTLCSKRHLCFTTEDGSTIGQVSPEGLKVLLGCPAGFKLGSRVGDARQILGNGVDGKVASEMIKAAKGVLAAANDVAEDLDHDAIDAVVLQNVEEHIAWWKRRQHKRKLVVEACKRDGIGRAKVLAHMAGNEVGKGVDPRESVFQVGESAYLRW